MQESLYKLQPDGTAFGATAFVLAVQCGTNAAVAALGCAANAAGFGLSAGAGASGGVARALTGRAAAQTSVVYALAMYSSNEALAFVSYPTQALVKSCKMIPVMLGSMLINAKRYSWVKYTCVALMSLGITWFQFAGERKAKHGALAAAAAPAAGAGGLFVGESLGLLLLGISLCLDGITGPLQEVLKSEHHLSPMEQMLVNNIWATALMVVIALGMGQGVSAVRSARARARAKERPAASPPRAPRFPAASPLLPPARRLRTSPRTPTSSPRWRSFRCAPPLARSSSSGPSSPLTRSRWPPSPPRASSSPSSCPSSCTATG